MTGGVWRSGQVGPDNWEQMASGGDPSGGGGGFGGHPFGGFADIFGDMQGAEIRFEGGAPFDLGDLLRNAQRMVNTPPPPPRHLYLFVMHSCLGSRMIFRLTSHYLK